MTDSANAKLIGGLLIVAIVVILVALIFPSLNSILSSEDPSDTGSSSSLVTAIEETPSGVEVTVVQAGKGGSILVDGEEVRQITRGDEGRTFVIQDLRRGETISIKPEDGEEIQQRVVVNCGNSESQVSRDVYSGDTVTANNVRGRDTITVTSPFEMTGEVTSKSGSTIKVQNDSELRSVDLEEAEAVFETVASDYKCEYNGGSSEDNTGNEEEGTNDDGTGDDTTNNTTDGGNEDNTNDGGDYYSGGGSDDSTTEEESPYTPISGGWEQFKLTANRRGTHNGPPLVKEVHEGWNVSVSDNPLIGSPVVDEDKLFVKSAAFSSGSGRLHKFDRINSSKEWSSRDIGSSPSSPAVSNSSVYISGNDGLYAYNRSSGDREWKTTLASGETIFSSPAVKDNTVYVGGFYKAYAINATDGSIKWGTPVQPSSAYQSLISSPAVEDGKVFIGGGQGNMTSLSASDGSVLWRTNIGSPIASTPSVDNGTVFVGSRGGGSSSGKVYSFDTETGTENWNTTVGTVMLSSPTTYNGSVYVNSQLGLHGIDTQTGKVEMKNAVSKQHAGFSSPIVVSDFIFVGGDMGGTVHAVSEKYDIEVWSKKLVHGTSRSLGAGVPATPAVKDGNVYIGTGSGRLVNISGCAAICTGNTTNVSHGINTGSEWNEGNLEITSGKGTKVVNNSLRMHSDPRWEKLPAPIDTCCFGLHSKESINVAGAGMLHKATKNNSTMLYYRENSDMKWNTSFNPGTVKVDETRNLIYVENESNNSLVALDYNGQQQWETKLGGGIGHLAYDNDGLFYSANIGGNFESEMGRIDPSTGAVTWSTMVSDDSDTTTPYKGLKFALGDSFIANYKSGNYSTTIVEFNKTTGDKLNEHHAVTEYEGDLYAVDDELYAATSTDVIVKWTWDGTDMTKNWDGQYGVIPPGDNTGNVFFDDSYMYRYDSTAQDGSIVKINRTTGDTVFLKDSVSSLSGINHKLVHNNHMFFINRRTLTKISLKNGTITTVKNYSQSFSINRGSHSPNDAYIDGVSSGIINVNLTKTENLEFDNSQSVYLSKNFAYNQTINFQNLSLNVDNVNSADMLEIAVLINKSNKIVQTGGLSGLMGLNETDGIRHINRSNANITEGYNEYELKNLDTAKNMVGSNPQNIYSGDYSTTSGKHTGFWITMYNETPYATNDIHIENISVGGQYRQCLAQGDTLYNETKSNQYSQELHIFTHEEWNTNTSDHSGYQTMNTSDDTAKLTYLNASESSVPDTTLTSKADWDDGNYGFVGPNGNPIPGMQTSNDNLVLNNSSGSYVRYSGWENTFNHSQAKVSSITFRYNKSGGYMGMFVINSTNGTYPQFNDTDHMGMADFSSMSGDTYTVDFSKISNESFGDTTRIWAALRNDGDGSTTPALEEVTIRYEGVSGYLSPGGIKKIWRFNNRTVSTENVAIDYNMTGQNQEIKFKVQTTNETEFSGFNSFDGSITDENKSRKTFRLAGRTGSNVRFIAVASTSSNSTPVIDNVSINVDPHNNTSPTDTPLIEVSDSKGNWDDTGELLFQGEYGSVHPRTYMTPIEQTGVNGNNKINFCSEVSTGCRGGPGYDVRDIESISSDDTVDFVVFIKDEYGTYNNEYKRTYDLKAINVTNITVGQWNITEVWQKNWTTSQTNATLHMGADNGQVFVTTYDGVRSLSASTGQQNGKVSVFNSQDNSSKFVVDEQKIVEVRNGNLTILDYNLSVISEQTGFTGPSGILFDNIDIMNSNLYVSYDEHYKNYVQKRPVSSPGNVTWSKEINLPSNYGHSPRNIPDIEAANGSLYVSQSYDGKVLKLDNSTGDTVGTSKWNPSGPLTYYDGALHYDARFFYSRDTSSSTYEDLHIREEISESGSGTVDYKVPIADGKFEVSDDVLLHTGFRDEMKLADTSSEKVQSALIWGGWKSKNFTLGGTYNFTTVKFEYKNNSENITPIVLGEIYFGNSTVPDDVVNQCSPGSTSDTCQGYKVVRFGDVSGSNYTAPKKEYDLTNVSDTTYSTARLKVRLMTFNLLNNPTMTEERMREIPNPTVHRWVIDGEPAG